MNVMYGTEDCYYKVSVFACNMVAFLVNITTDTQNSQQYTAINNIQINKLKRTHN
jgi:hypothetical protein